MKQEKVKVLPKLLSYADNKKPLIILSIMASSISAILGMFPFICIWNIIREIFNVWPNFSKATQISYYGWHAVIYAVSSIILYFLSLMFSHLAAFRIEKNMRKYAMHKIIYFPIGYCEKETSGKLRKIIDDNASLTHGFVAHQLPDLAGAFIMPIAIFIVLFIYDWRLGLICLIPLFLSILFLKQIMGGTKANFMHNYMNSLEDMNTSAVEYVRGIPVVKVFQQTVYSFKNFNESIEKYSKFASDYSIACRIPLINYTMTINLPSILLTIFGLLMLKNTTNFKGLLLDLIFYMLFFPLCVTMMTKIMLAGESIMSAKEAINRLEKVLEVEPLYKTNNPLQTAGYDIEFENVSFTYPDSKKPAIDHVSLRIPEGKVFAIVGESGGGKSTLANLIPRLWDTNAGNIKIGGVDICEINKEELMNNIGIVSQNSKLFKDSILENIRIGKKEATREEILKAAHLAQCDDILEKMPQGIDTIIGTKGVYLSGGEKQRVSIARTILKDSPILILDEATAYADPENEYIIQKVFKTLMKDKTVLMIAHRLNSVTDVDCILVMNDGKIIEQGSFKELIDKKGKFSSMWEEYQKSIVWKVGKEKGYA